MRLANERKEVKAMLAPNLPNAWLAVPALIVIGLLLIVSILFGAMMDSLIAPTAREEIRDSFRRKKETGYDTLTE
jgi:hypothetical protein